MKRSELKWCRKCEAATPATVRRVNHVLHLLLTLITLGMWLPIYALVGMETSVKSDRCQKCGGKV